jgi:glycosyltransferase involved in cell wall biosynthesis
MKILMLGWEFPPLISGGLATATEGLVSGLTQLGHQIALVLPHFPHATAERIEELNPNLTIVSPEHPYQPQRLRRSSPTLAAHGDSTSAEIAHLLASEQIKRMAETAQGTLSAAPLSHYDTANIEALNLSGEEQTVLRTRLVAYQKWLRERLSSGEGSTEASWSPLRGDVAEQTELLSLLATDIVQNEISGLFDVIHAHDWMSLKAIAQLKKHSPLPVVLHVHSTEFDRAGQHGNQKILSLEKMGFHLADRLVAVSHLTRRVLMEHYGVSGDKIDVVYNASNLAHHSGPDHSHEGVWPAMFSAAAKTQSPLISFVGRVTYQKGPAYFVQAAQRALQLQPNLRFQVIGAGDLLPSMKQLAWELGVHDTFTFHGFQSAKKVETLLAQSDVFVMPSVSEPFGIVALEAMAQRIPIIISKQSGVAECLMHALKVDFWDTDLMADRIVSLVRRPILKRELQRNGVREMQRFSWESSARRCVDVYQKSALKLLRS